MIWNGLHHFVRALSSPDHQDVPSPPVAVDEAHHVPSVHVPNGRLLGTPRAHDVEAPDTLVKGHSHRVLVLQGDRDRLVVTNFRYRICQGTSCTLVQTVTL